MKNTQGADTLQRQRFSYKSLCSFVWYDRIGHFAPTGGCDLRSSHIVLQLSFITAICLMTKQGNNYGRGLAHQMFSLTVFKKENQTFHVVKYFQLLRMCFTPRAACLKPEHVKTVMSLISENKWSIAAFRILWSHSNRSAAVGSGSVSGSQVVVCLLIGRERI